MKIEVKLKVELPYPDLVLTLDDLEVSEEEWLDLSGIDQGYLIDNWLSEHLDEIDHWVDIESFQTTEQ